MTMMRICSGSLSKQGCPIACVCRPRPLERRRIACSRVFSIQNCNRISLLLWMRFALSLYLVVLRKSRHRRPQLCKSPVRQAHENSELFSGALAAALLLLSPPRPSDRRGSRATSPRGRGRRRVHMGGGGEDPAVAVCAAAATQRSSLAMPCACTCTCHAYGCTRSAPEQNLRHGGKAVKTATT